MSKKSSLTTKIMKVEIDIKPIVWIKSMYVAMEWFIKNILFIKFTIKQINCTSASKQAIIICKLGIRREIRIDWHELNCI